MNFWLFIVLEIFSLSIFGLGLSLIDICKYFPIFIMVGGFISVALIFKIMCFLR